MSLARFIAPLFVVCSVSVLGACTVTTRPEPVYATTEVTAAPVQVETAPQAQYEGRTVYLYNDHWYYRNGNRWNYYNSDPPQLQRQRQYVKQAPPAARPAPYEERREGPRNEPAPRYENGPSTAPPAVRVQ